MAVVGVAFGVALSWFERSLPDPLGAIVLYLFLAAVIAWAICALLWARRLLRDLHEDHEGPL